MQKKSLLLVALATTFGTAHADQAAVKSSLDQMLSMYIAGSDKIDGYRVTKDFTLTAKGNDTYTTTLTDFTYVGSADTNGLEIPLGPVQITAVEKGDEVIVDLVMTSSIKVKNKEGELATINIGSQDTKYTWSKANGFYTNSVMKLGDISTKVEGVEVTVASVNAVNRAAKVGGHWTMPIALDMGNIAIKNAKGESYTVASVTGKGFMDVTNPQDLMNASKTFSALSEGGKKPSDEAMQQALGKIMELFTRYDFNMTMNEFVIGRGGKTMFTLGSVGLGSDYAFKTEGSDFGFQLSAANLTSAMPMLPPGFMPENLNINLEMSKLPKDFFNRFMKIQAEGDKKGGFAGKKYTDQQMMNMFTEAGTRFGFKKTRLHSEKVKFDLDSDMTINGKNKSPVHGDLNLVITGLQDLKKLLTMMGMMKQAGPVIGMMEAMSDVKTENGVTTNTLGVKISPENKVEINGKDISALMGG